MPTEPDLDNLPSRLTDPDAVYRLIIAAHRGLDEAASADLNVRLVLVLANEVGCEARIRRAIEAAQAAMPAPGMTP